MPQAVLRAIDMDYDEQRWERAAALAGRFHDTVRDVATRHDAYLADTYRR